MVGTKNGKAVFSETVKAKTKQGEAVVSISDTTATVYVGGGCELILNGIPKGAKVTWKSADTKIASVDKSGVITAKKKGNTTITATYDKKEYKCEVTVNPKRNAFDALKTAVKEHCTSRSMYSYDIRQELGNNYRFEISFCNEGTNDEYVVCRYGHKSGNSYDIDFMVCFRPWLTNAIDASIGTLYSPLYELDPLLEEYSSIYSFCNKDGIDIRKLKMNDPIDFGTYKSYQTEITDTKIINSLNAISTKYFYYTLSLADNYISDWGISLKEFGFNKLTSSKLQKAVKPD